MNYPEQNTHSLYKMLKIIDDTQPKEIQLFKNIEAENIDLAIEAMQKPKF